MKVRYIVALLMIVLMVGCATKQQEAAPAEAAAPETPPAAPAEAAAPETPPAAPAEAAAPADLSDADKAQVDRLKTACERGNAGLCSALKNRYNIDWPSKATEEPEVSEEGGSAGEATE